MRRIVILLFCLHFCFQGFAQSESSTEFLATAYKDPSYLLYGEASTALSKQYRAISPVDQLEFRAKMNEMQADMMDYTIRLKTNSLFQIGENKKLESSTVERNRIAALVSLNELFRQRYDILIDYYESVDKKPLLDSLASYYLVYDKFIKNNQLNSSSQWMKSIMDYEQDYLQFKISYKRFELNSEQVTSSLTSLGGEPQLIQDGLTKLPEADFIMDWIITQDESFAIPVDLSLLQAELQVDERRVDFERKSGIQILNFLEAGYDVDNVIRDRNPYHIQVGFLIPIANSNRSEINKMTVRKIETQIEYNDEKAKIKSRLNELRKQIYFQYDSYLIYRAFIEESFTAKAMKSLSGNADSEIILETTGRMVQARIDMRESYFELLRLWVNYLDVSGALIKDPYLNYLDYSFPEIGSE